MAHIYETAHEDLKLVMAARSALKAAVRHLRANPDKISGHEKFAETLFDLQATLKLEVNNEAVRRMASEQMDAPLELQNVRSVHISTLGLNVKVQGDFTPEEHAKFNIIFRIYKDLLSVSKEAALILIYNATELVSVQWAHGTPNLKGWLA